MHSQLTGLPGGCHLENSFSFQNGHVCGISNFIFLKTSSTFCLPRLSLSHTQARVERVSQSSSITIHRADCVPSLIIDPHLILP